MAYAALDYYALDELYTHEERMVRDTVRELVTARIMPSIGMLTVATRTQGGYMLRGTKRWITNGSVAHVALVWAKLDGVVRGFLVPTQTAGFSAKAIHGKWSLRASVTSELVLDEVVVGED